MAKSSGIWLARNPLEKQVEAVTDNLTQPDWFDRLWEQIKPGLNPLFRSESVKNSARSMVGMAFDVLGKHAKTPEGMRQLVAFARIASAVKNSRAAFASPDPSPEEVVEFVERMMQKVKP